MPAWLMTNEARAATMTPAVAPSAPRIGRSLQDGHRHRVDDGEQDDDAHDRGDEEKQGTEKLLHLDVEWVQVTKISDVQLHPPFSEQRIEPRTGHLQVFRATQLHGDARDLRRGAPVDQLLG